MPPISGAYAKLSADIRHRPDRAEKFFKRALEVHQGPNEPWQNARFFDERLDASKKTSISAKVVGSLGATSSARF